MTSLDRFPSQPPQIRCMGCLRMVWTTTDQLCPDCENSPEPEPYDEDND